MFALQTASLACLWALQYLAMRGPTFPAVVTSQLAGNALAKIAPGGGAVGAALQYRMLVQAGLPRRRAVAGLTACNLLVFAAVLAMPVLAVPAILRGGVEPRPARGGRRRGRGVRGAVRGRRGADRLRRRAGMGRPGDPERPQPDPAARRAAADAARAPAARARPDRRHPRAALEARAGGDQRPLGVRLRHAAGRARRGGVAAAAVARAARVLRRAGARADPDHAGRARASSRRA